MTNPVFISCQHDFTVPGYDKKQIIGRLANCRQNQHDILAPGWGLEAKPPKKPLSLLPHKTHTKRVNI